MCGWRDVEFCLWVEIADPKDHTEVSSQFPEFAWSSALGFGREQNRDSERVKLICEITLFPAWYCVESCKKLCLPEPVCSIVTVLAFLPSEDRRLIVWIQVLT